MNFITIIIVLLIISFLVVVHELGHYWAARRNGIRVEEFGIGYPPKLFGKKFGETLYSINLIPFGGFVRIAGEDDEDVNEDDVGSFTTKHLGKISGVVGRCFYESTFGLCPLLCTVFHWF